MAGELEPGSMGRRYLPEKGLKRHRDKIHRESAEYDKKNMPFTFSKPPRRGSTRTFQCLNCGHVFEAPKKTIMVICSVCKQLSKVRELDHE
jgi:ribosomal protein L37AE/L43A